MLTRRAFFEQDIAVDLLITQSLKERTKGLLALDQLRAKQGLLITPCSSIHTFGMSYPLDLVYLNRAQRIIKLVKNVRPNRMSFGFLAHSTLEFNAGEIDRLQLKKGMQLTLG